MSSYSLVRRIFVRLVALCFLIAFLSFWVQADGLVGSRGILPAQKFLAAAARELGPRCYRLLPTLCWLNSGDRALHWLCAGGTFVSLAALSGIFQGPMLLIAWAFYLSLVSPGQDFYSFQWDNLLLEIGFLTSFFAPWTVLENRNPDSQPSKILLWLLRWVLFRLMFQSGCVKLVSGDPNWRNLAALEYHYETQCLPTWIAWYAHQLPAWLQKVSAASMFVIELAVPWLIFAPRRWRLGGCAALLSLQILIAATGNYCFFNLLTAALCVLLLDDAFLRRWIFRDGNDGVAAASAPAAGHRTVWDTAKLAMTGLLAANVLAVSLAEFSGILGASSTRLPRFAAALLEAEYPFRTINNYGLFAVMTTVRDEIILEGSRDGNEWKPYEFKWKPGDVRRRPAFVAPHQPRLDWQMWFAALGSYRQNIWVLRLMAKILEASPPVLSLLADNPFPDAPPRYIRAVVYEYHFTNFSQRRTDGAWWRREFKGLYAPVLERRI